jgi:hypothetical protein
MKLNFIRHGFAAGCEAGLRPAVNNIKGGAGMGLARTRGIAQIKINQPTARQSLASHPAAKPELMKLSSRIVLDPQGAIPHPAAAAVQINYGDY